jgi:HSP20 family protein
MRALTLRTPARELSSRPREFEDLLGRFFGTPVAWPSVATTGRWMPPLESFQRDGELVVRLDVPGIDPQALDISVEGDRLTVKGERKSSRDETSEGHVYREVVYGSFERSVSLPWEVDSDSVKAACKDGVLEISMKAPERAGPKKIPILQ